MSGSASLRGTSTDRPASRGIYAPRDSILLPPTRAPLEGAKIREASLDILKLFLVFLFVTVAGLMLLGGALLRFVRL